MLLSDGAANAGQDPISVAAKAAKQQIAIYTVALGTSSGSLPNPDPFGPPVAVPPDPQLMQQIAHTSHGRSFSAKDAGGLISIYKGLGTQLGSKSPPDRHHARLRRGGPGAAARRRGRIAALERPPPPDRPPDGLPDRGET